MAGMADKKDNPLRPTLVEIVGRSCWTNMFTQSLRQVFGKSVASAHFMFKTGSQPKMFSRSCISLSECSV